MIAEAQTLVDEYLAWLRDRTKLREVGQHVEITTPFIDRHNDYLQLYVQRDNSGFKLTDGGYVLSDLKLSGCDVSTKKRQSLLHTTLNGFGVRLEHDALVVHASAQDFPVKKHNLVQAMLAVNDLFYVAQGHVISLFKEDVTSWLETNDVRFVPQAKFTGKSGFDHLFDYVIPKSRHQPERIVQAVATADKQAATRLAFSWSDTASTRPADAQGYALLNDSENLPAAGVTDALEAYGVVPVLWSQRESVREALAA